MANSRKPRIKRSVQLQSSAESSQTAIQTCLAQLLKQYPKVLQALKNTLLESVGEQPWAIALSGGPDSAALALCAAALFQAQQDQIQSTSRSKAKTKQPLLQAPKLFHIHHGLQSQADGWQAQVQDLSQLLGLDLIVHRVVVDLKQGQGMEAAARLARYEALQTMAAQANIAKIVLAHHLNDQAETVLQRLFRGAGVAGMGAMQTVTKQASLVWLRPWLDLSREAILEVLVPFREATGWVAVDDPTNLDPELARGLIRRHLAGPIGQHWPRWQQNLARHARQAQQAQNLLLQYGDLLIEQIRLDTQPVESIEPVSPVNKPPNLDLRGWRALSGDQQALVIRTWLDRAGRRMPTEARLSELCRQLNQLHALGHDRHLLWRQSDCEVKCHAGIVSLHVTMDGPLV